MPSISDFKKSLREMSDDELNELIDTTRNDRTSGKKKKKKKKKKQKERTTSSNSDSFEDLSPEEAQDLLNRLQNG